ncbi:MAG: DUF5320 domain-containing protein [Calditrichales bacterium]|nr:DUF5320 domain-containing protein [Calditrichales bacterium]
MPRGDRTGPAGMGPMTGRAAGYCAGYNTPGFANPISGRGFWGAGRGGFGGGRGHRNMYYATGLPRWDRFGGDPYAATYPAQMTSAQESDYLNDQAKYFQDALENINKRIEELESESKKK